MTASAKLLDRLDGVRETGPGKWRARCPAHGSTALSIAIAEVDDRVLLHAFCGCGTDAVLAAVGLSVAELFDRRPGDHGRTQRKPWSARDVLDLVLVEAHLVGIIAGDLLERRTITEMDWRRLAQATARLVGVASEVKP